MRSRTPARTSGTTRAGTILPRRVAASMPASFEIGGANFRPLQQFAARSAQRNGAVDHHVAAMRKPQRMVGVLFDDQHRESVVAVELANRVKNLSCNQGSQAKR